MSVKVKPLSNYEGYKRLEASLEKIGRKAEANSKVCDVCHRRVRAWRIVPAKFGSKLGKTMASRQGALTGRFAVVCDTGPDSCARMLERSGVAAEGIRYNELEARVGKLGIILSALAALCLIAGCSYPPIGLATPARYELALSWDLEPDTRAAVRWAATEWGVLVPTVIGVHDGEAERGDIVVQSGALAVGQVAVTTPGLIRIDETQVRAHGLAQYLPQVAAHELGHAQGLGHTAPGTVMCASLDCQASWPTQADAEQWERVHGGT